MVRREHATLVRTFPDLVQQRLRFVNRQAGSGTRILFEGSPAKVLWSNPDGSLAVVTLKNCQSPTPELAQVNTHTAFKPGNKTFRYVRRQILTFRSDIWRANIIYAAYDLGHMSFTAIKHHNTLEAYQREMAQHEKQAPPSIAPTPPQAGTSSALLGTE